MFRRSVHVPLNLECRHKEKISGARPSANPGTRIRRARRFAVSGQTEPDLAVANLSVSVLLEARKE
jgi:hypothetical protein